MSTNKMWLVVFPTIEINNLEVLVVQVCHHVQLALVHLSVLENRQYQVHLVDQQVPVVQMVQLDLVDLVHPSLL